MKGQGRESGKKKIDPFLLRDGEFMIIKIVLSILFIATAFVSEAHVHSHAVEDIEHIEKLYGLAVTLSPAVLDSVDTSSAQPYIKIGGKYVLLDTGFWQLVQGWVRLYRREIEQYCPCDIDEQKIVQEARDEIARGFVDTKITRNLSNFGEFVIVGAYGLSARYGKAALLLKAAAEVAEHTLSIVFSKGAVVICNAIDFMILFLFRRSQIYVRVFNNSKTLDQSRFLSVMRLAWFRRLMKKKNKSVFLYLQSAEIDGHALDHVNEEGAKVRLFRWTIKKDQREKWVRSLSQKMEPILNRTREIDAQLENESLSAKDRRQLLKERRKLVKKSEKLTQVHRKFVLGEGYGLSLWLFNRKWHPQYLNGETLADRLTSKDFIWPLGLQENTLERALVRQVEEAGLMQDHSTLRLPPDEIRTGLAEEFAEKMRQDYTTTGHVHSIERVLRDVEKVFDPSLKMAERYLIVSIIESGFLGLFEFYLLRVMYPKLIQSTEGLNLLGRARLRWRLDRFIYYVFMYSDFLRTVALTKDPSKINSYKYESMEAFLSLFEHLHQVSKLPREAHTKESLLARLDEYLYRVQSLQPHLEKRTTYSWIRIPFIRPLPMCRSLVRVAR